MQARHTKKSTGGGLAAHLREATCTPLEMQVWPPLSLQMPSRMLGKARLPRPCGLEQTPAAPKCAVARGCTWETIEVRGKPVSATENPGATRRAVQ